MFYAGLGVVGGFSPKEFTPATNPNTNRYFFPPNTGPWRGALQNIVTGIDIGNLRVSPDTPPNVYKISVDVLFPQ